MIFLPGYPKHIIIYSERSSWTREQIDPHCFEPLHLDADIFSFHCGILHLPVTLSNSLSYNAVLPRLLSINVKQLCPLREHFASTAISIDCIDSCSGCSRRLREPCARAAPAANAADLLSDGLAP